MTYLLNSNCSNFQLLPTFSFVIAQLFAQQPCHCITFFNGTYCVRPICPLETPTYTYTLWNIGKGTGFYNSQNHTYVYSSCCHSKNTSVCSTNSVSKTLSIVQYKTLCETAKNKIYFKYIFFFNWDSPHARLNSRYEAWSYRKRSTKRITGNRKSV